MTVEAVLCYDCWEFPSDVNVRGSLNMHNASRWHHYQFSLLEPGIPTKSSNLPAILVKYVADRIGYIKYDVFSTNNMCHVRLWRKLVHTGAEILWIAGMSCAQVSRVWLSFPHSAPGAQTRTSDGLMELSGQKWLIRGTLGEWKVTYVWSLREDGGPRSRRNLA